jgi:uncharacterized protein YecT (DUF1311 family)
MKVLLIISIGITLALSGRVLPSHSQDPPAQALNCDQAVTQRDITLCAKQRAEAADSRLNGAYQKLQYRFAADLRRADNAQIGEIKKQYQRLINAENTWIKFRDATCDYERHQFEGGSIAQITYYSCVTKVTDRRTAELQEYLNF